jgi:hypothetical protein
MLTIGCTPGPMNEFFAVAAGKEADADVTGACGGILAGVVCVAAGGDVSI